MTTMQNNVTDNNVGELKPCPFCDGEAELKNKTSCEGHGIYITKYYVMCKSCGCRGASKYVYNKTKDQCITEATEVWNRRV